MKQSPRHVDQGEELVALLDGSSLILFALRPSPVVWLDVYVVTGPGVDVYVLRASDDVVCECILVLFDEYVLVLADLYRVDSQIHRLLARFKLPVRRRVRDIPLSDVYCHSYTFLSPDPWVRGSFDMLIYKTTSGLNLSAPLAAPLLT